jgi:hypothetical protein
MRWRGFGRCVTISKATVCAGSRWFCCQGSQASRALCAIGQGGVLAHAVGQRIGD